MWGLGALKHSLGEVVLGAEMRVLADVCLLLASRPKRIDVVLGSMIGRIIPALYITNHLVNAKCFSTVLLELPPPATSSTAARPIFGDT